MTKLFQLVALVGFTAFGSAQAGQVKRLKCEIPYATRTTHISFVVQGNDRLFSAVGQGTAHIRVNYLGTIHNSQLKVSSYYHKAYGINIFHVPQGGAATSFTLRAVGDQQVGQTFPAKYSFGQYSGDVKCRFLN